MLEDIADLFHDGADRAEWLQESAAFHIVHVSDVERHPNAGQLPIADHLKTSYDFQADFQAALGGPAVECRKAFGSGALRF